MVVRGQRGEQVGGGGWNWGSGGNSVRKGGVGRARERLRQESRDHVIT